MADTITITVDGVGDVDVDRAFLDLPEAEQQSVLQSIMQQASADEDRGVLYDTGLGQAASRMGETFATELMGLPVSVGRTVEAVANLPDRGINAVANLMGYEGDLIADTPSAFPPGTLGSPEYFREMFRDDDSLYAQMTGERFIQPPNPDLPLANKAGELAGLATAALAGAGRYGTPQGAAGTALRTPGTASFADDVATSLSRPWAGVTVPATELGLGYSSALGGEIAAEVGGEPWRPVGEIAGGALPSVLSQGAKAGVSSVFGDELSPVRYETAKRLGIPITPGMIGSDAARLAENAAAVNPLATGVVRSRQEAQAEGLESAFQDSMTRIRPEGVDAAADPYQAGARVSAAIETTDPVTGKTTGALPRLQEELNRLTQQQLDAVGGPNQGLDVARVKRAVDRQIRKATPADRRSLEQWKRELEEVRTTPIDPALDAQIRNRLATREARLRALEGSNKPLNRKELREARNLRYRISQDQKQLDANMGVSADMLNKMRMQLGQSTQQRDRVAASEAKQVYGATRAAERDATLDADALDRYTNAVTEKRRISGDENLETGGEIDFLRKLASKEPEQVFRTLSTPEAAGRLIALKRVMAPEAFNTFAADMLTMMAAPGSMNARSAGLNADTFSPSAFGTKWIKLPEASKAALIEDPAVRQELDDLFEMSMAQVQRGQTANTSNSANLVGYGGATFGLGTAPVTTLTMMGAGRWATQLFMSDALAAIIARQYPEFRNRFGPRGTAIAGGQAGQALQEDETE